MGMKVERERDLALAQNSVLFWRNMELETECTLLRTCSVAMLSLLERIYADFDDEEVECDDGSVWTIRDLLASMREIVGETDA